MATIVSPIVERLLKLLNPVQDGGRPTKRYVQEQAVTTLAMVADASETTFAKVSVFTSIELGTGDEAGNHNSTTVYIDHAAPAQRAKEREHF